MQVKGITDEQESNLINLRKKSVDTAQFNSEVLVLKPPKYKRDSQADVEVRQSSQMNPRVSIDKATGLKKMSSVDVHHEWSLPALDPKHQSQNS